MNREYETGEVGGGNFPQLIEKMQKLSPSLLREVENFVEFMMHKEKEEYVDSGFSLASHAAFARVWDNPEDSIYDDVRG